MAAVSTLLANIVRLPVSAYSHIHHNRLILTVIKIPDKSLDAERPSDESESSEDECQPMTEEPERVEGLCESENEDLAPIRPLPTRRRRLSTYESSDSVLDLEDDEIGVSARPESRLHTYMGTPRSR